MGYWTTVNARLVAIVAFLNHFIWRKGKEMKGKGKGASCSNSGCRVVYLIVFKPVEGEQISKVHETRMSNGI